MLEVKELVNSCNQEIFLNRKHLREQVIYSFNKDAEEIIKDVIAKNPLVEMEFNHLNGAIALCEMLGLITASELRNFMDILIHCMHCDMCLKLGRTPRMCNDGTILFVKNS